MREELIVSYRSQLNLSGFTEIEQFQNSVLRPILKFQHDWLVVLSENFVFKQFKNWDSLDSIDRSKAVKSIFVNNKEFRQIIIGGIIGLLNREELRFYLLHGKPINRRIIQMSCERVLSTMNC